MLFFICVDIMKEWNSVSLFFFFCVCEIYMWIVCVYFIERNYLFVKGFFFFIWGVGRGRGGEGGGGEYGCIIDEKEDFIWCNFIFIVLYLFWNIFLGVIGLCVLCEVFILFYSVWYFDRNYFYNLIIIIWK